MLCIYHANCTDGFTAAWAVWKRFPECEFFPGKYGQTPPDVSGKNVVMVDFSYKKSVIDEMAKTAKSILILDHHKSAAEDLAEFPETPYLEGYYGWLPGSGVYVTFDMERSGARITWDHFHGTSPGLLVLHVEDRDLWKFNMENTKNFSAVLFSYDQTFENWDLIDHICGDESLYWSFVESGNTLVRKQTKDLKEILQLCMRTMKIGEFAMPTASLPYTMASEAGQLMCGDDGCSATYYDTLTHRIFSLRSADKGLDVSLIAKKYGGGGHKHAAGFSVERSHELARR